MKIVGFAMLASLAASYEYARIPADNSTTYGFGGPAQCLFCEVAANEFDVWLTNRTNEDLLEGVAEMICMKYVI